MFLFVQNFAPLKLCTTFARFHHDTSLRSNRSFKDLMRVPRASIDCESFVAFLLIVDLRPTNKGISNVTGPYALTSRIHVLLLLSTFSSLRFENLAHSKFKRKLSFLKNYHNSLHNIHRIYTLNNLAVHYI